jgi:hypothetical protein
MPIKLSIILSGVSLVAGLAGISFNFNDKPHEKELRPILSTQDSSGAFGKECDVNNFKSFADDQNCLRTASQKVKSFSDAFTNQLYNYAGLDKNANRPADLAKAWANLSVPNSAQHEKDIRTIRNYEIPCSDVLNGNIRDPAAPLRFSHTTGYGAARYCLESAIRIAKNSGIKIDFKAATDMLSAIDDLYAHYDQHPIGEGSPAYGTKELINPF